MVQLAHGMVPFDRGLSDCLERGFAVVERTLNSRLEDGHLVFELLMDNGILEMRDTGEVFFPMPSFHGCMMSFAPPSRRRPRVLGRS